MADAGASNTVDQDTSSSRLDNFDRPTVWQEFRDLVNETGAVNLGQGYPDWPSPDFIKEAVNDAVGADLNQYTRSQGHLPLVEALAERYSGLLSRQLDPLTNVTVCVGASGALFSSFQGFLNPGDEVVLIEPMFDIYMPQVQMAGGVCKFVPLRPTKAAPGAAGEGKQQDSGDGEGGSSPLLHASSWALDMEELRAALSGKTRALVLNNPHNPSGKAFTAAELTAIAATLSQFEADFAATTGTAHRGIICVCDDVYDTLTFDGVEHVYAATIPGMWERTLTIGSAGKMFSVTGWKIGWVVGPPYLVKPVALSNQYIQFTIATPLQEAVARAIRRAQEPYQDKPSFFEWHRCRYQEKRDALVAALRTAGLRPMVPQGSFFVMADISALDIPEEYLQQATAACPEMTRDWAAARWLVREKGIGTIPFTPFYSEEHKQLGSNTIRFAFCKKDKTLEAAALKLAALATPAVEE